jgi:hypothetical protein
MPVAPTAVKLVAVSFGSLQPEDERITLLIREPINLTGHRIEKREVAPGPPLALDSTDAALSIWTTLYEFGPEPMAVSGTRIVIFSGNPDNPPAPESRTWHRFRAPTGAPGDVQFTTDAVDLRIISPQGDILHARRFLNDTTMVQSVGFRLLRKADGTACFLLPPATLGAGFSPQSFQITLVFRRNNTAIDPGSLVLSAAGLTSAEAVVLDIPWTTL